MAAVRDDLTNRRWKSYVLCLFAFLYTSLVYAQSGSGPSNINISGVLFDSTGTAITAPSVSFKIELYDKTGACLLYTEDHLGIDLSQTKGAFAIDIGSGSNIQNLIDSTTPAAMSSKVYENPGAIAGGWSGCLSGATLADGDSRVIRIKYNLGGGYVTMNPDVPLASAAYATVAQTLQGKRPSDFIQVHNDVSNKLTQANVENVFSSTNYPKLTDLLSGASTSYISSTPSSAVSFNNQLLTNVAAPVAANDATNKGYVDGNIGGKSADLTGVGPATGDGYTLIWDQATQKWTTGTPTSTDNTKLPLAGGTLTGTIDFAAAIGTGINLNGNDLLGTGHITMSPLKTLTLGAFTSAQETTLIGTLTAANAGASWYNTTSNTFKIWNGSAAISQTFSGATAGGDLTGSYPNPTIANDKITSAKVDSAGIGLNRLVISDQTTGASLKFATCGTNEVLRYEGVNGWTCRDPSSIVTFPVDSVNGKTGAVVLNANDLGLGTAALENVGTAAGEIPVLDGMGKIPAAMIPAASAPTWGDITNSAGKFMTYKPNNTACGNDELLKFDGTNWVCTSVSALGTGDFMKNGSVAMTGNFNAGGNSILGNMTASANLTLESTSNATKGFVLIQPNGGNVGIGTTSPGYPLDVVKTQDATTSINVRNASTGSNASAEFRGVNNAGANFSLGIMGSNAAYSFQGTNDTYLTSSGGMVFWSNAGTSSIRFANGSSEMMMLDNATGNVGIGTSSPDRLLHVNGPVRITPATLPSSPSAGDLAFDSASANALKFYDGSAWQTVGTGTGSGDFKKDGSVAMTGNFNAGGNSILGNTMASANLTLESTSNATKGSVLIQPNGGNVGIGTTTTLNKLDVAGGIAVGDYAGTQTAPTGGMSISGPVAIGQPDTYGAMMVVKYDGANSSLINGLTVVNGNSGSDGPVLTFLHAYGTWGALSAGDVIGSIDFKGADSGNSRFLMSQIRSDIVDPTAGAVKSNITFATTNGTTSTDRVVIDPSGYVGIGTTTPARSLDVNGPIRINPAALPSSPAAGDLAFDSGASNALKFYDGSAWQTVGTGTGTGDFMKNGSVAMTGNFNAGGNSILGNTTASANLTLESTSNATKGFVLIQPNGGKVGIGTTTPTYDLEVAGAAMLGGTVIGSQAGVTPNLQDDGFGNTYVIAPNANGSVLLSNSGSSSSALLNANFFDQTVTIGRNTSSITSIQGNMGIGTTAPARPLHVNGAARLTPTTTPGSPAAGDMFFDSAASNALKFYDGSAWQTVGTGTGTGDFMKNGSVAMTGNFNAGGNSILGNTTASANLTLESTSNATKGKVLIQPNGGNVGIGTNSPGALLEVMGNQLITYPVNDAWGANLILRKNRAGAIVQNNDEIGYFRFDGYDGASYQPAAAIDANVDGTPGSADMPTRLTFSTTSDGSNTVTERMRITSAGKVGVGTSSPNTTLDVNGSINATDDIWVGSNSVLGLVGSKVVLGDVGANGLTLGLLANGSERLTVDASGNVGIGTTTPAEMLHLYKGSGFTTMRFDAGAVQGQLFSDATIGKVALGSNSNHQLRLVTNDVDRMTIDTSGNVGIGTTSPARPLHVNGAARFTPTTTPGTPAAGDMFFDSAASNALKFYDGSAWQTVGTGGGTGDFKKDGSVAMTGNFNAGGNSILGDTSASGNLTLESTSNATKGNVLVQPNGGSVAIGTTGVTTVHSAMTHFASVEPKLEIQTGTGTGSYEEAVILRHDANANTAVNRRIGLLMKLSWDTDANEAAKMGGMVLESNYVYANAPDLHFLTNDAKRMTIMSTGSVGIGTTSPAATLDVNGAIKSAAVSNSTASVDFSTGNLQYTSVSCGAITLNNMKSGATYALAVQGTSGGTCAFTAYSGNGSGALTVKSGTVNLSQTASKDVIFSFMVMGSVVYVTAVDGY